MRIAILFGTVAVMLAGCAPPTPEPGPETLPRIRTERVAAAAALLPAGTLVQPGVLTVAATVGQLPLADYSHDGTSVVGVESDIAQLIADGLGLQLRIVPVAWADWPLGLTSGKYDAVLSNVTVTEERKARFDFSTYRDDKLGIYARSDSPLKSVREAKDIAGLKITVGASTNQSQILDRWNAANVAAGRKPAEPQYYDDAGLARLAVLSGRADVSFGPNAISAYEARDGKTRKVGEVPGGWPLTAYIAVATRKGSGLAPAITATLNARMGDGSYRRVLERWNLVSEGIARSETNPPGLPRG
ncbi:ABC transporter substrate-binding protein [Sphingomonas sp.]|uniref:ABC transporter substrate-binding protein n=1 Tax=Sphingomonas sp. TaxID=28214 RepID=UPI002DD6910D|nr:ABC transporter substrate-binding protein [Sphingomonas sp.]